VPMSPFAQPPSAGAKSGARPYLSRFNGPIAVATIVAAGFARKKYGRRRGDVPWRGPARHSSTLGIGIGKRHPLSGHQAQGQRRHPQRSRPRMPRRIPRPCQDLRQTCNFILRLSGRRPPGRPRRQSRSPAVGTHPRQSPSALTARNHRCRPIAGAGAPPSGPPSFVLQLPSPVGGAARHDTARAETP
jgi:hypothetical protein